MLATRPEVRPVVMVPVAVRPATERLPEKRPPPCTESVMAGVEVPIPRELPMYPLPVADSTVEDAYVANVEEAMSEKGEVAVSHSGVEVEFTAVPE